MSVSSLEELNLNFHYTSERVQYKGKWIETYVFGTGDKTIFAFPSFPHSGFVYQLFTRFYDQTKFRFVTFDLPGWGGWSEDVFQNREFDVDDYIEIAVQIIEHFGLNRFSLIGYSFGGALAVKLAVDKRVKDKIVRIALVSAIVKAGLSRKYMLCRLVGLAHMLRFGAAIKLNVMNALDGSIKVLSKYLDPGILSEYWQRMNHSDSRILLESANCLLLEMNLDEELNQLAAMRPQIMIVNSKDEPKLFQEQADFMRSIFTSENSYYIAGEHYDFILRPTSASVHTVMKFLLDQDTALSIAETIGELLRKGLRFGR